MNEIAKPAENEEVDVTKTKLLNKDSMLRLIVIAGIIGIALIFISSVFKKEDAGSSKPDSEINTPELTDVTIYRQELCEELGNMIASIEGAGKTKIMLTTDGTVRNIYAADNDIQERESSRRNDADENTDKQSNEKVSYITVRSKDGSEHAVTIGQLMPSIRGVLVVCEGGGSEQVCKRIKEAVAAALNISQSNICVTKMVK